ncbi:unnamed protein product [Linum tenue]|uniref:Uncharacterized protein n=1 Tax=Linum tenue TaxID=586396 RepID=A0AAV0M536_9ROSI|nr:unnamed protein product [Linum tenue]
MNKMRSFNGLLAMISSSFLWVYAFTFIAGYPIPTFGNIEVASNVLIPGNELWKETLALQGGSRLYELRGLKSNTWYEVKISYPASVCMFIPASFTIQLKKDVSGLGLNWNRRLLNTEKLIFKTDEFSGNQQNQLYVLVTVEPEGVVAIPNVPEREAIIFNIANIRAYDYSCENPELVAVLCDELLLGIPHKAWWVGVLVLLCLVAAFIIPRFLPALMPPENGSSISSSYESVAKES